MITVEEAENIVLNHATDFGTEEVAFADCYGRVLAEDITADRDLPPFNRVTMDGIAIKYAAIERGITVFELKGTQLAGDTPLAIAEYNSCIAIMTGAALPDSADTVIPVEQIRVVDNLAFLSKDVVITKHQNIHFKGRDKVEGAILAAANQVITEGIITVCAAVGKFTILVKKKPRTVIISTGNELVDVHEKPGLYQIRRSNNYALDAALRKYHIPASMLHLPDDKAIIEKELEACLKQYDIIILSGGVSMGTSDYIPVVLEQLQVEKLFHKVKQRPGKPFWFGKHRGGATVFAFPGNPVSSFLCFHRYLLPWLMACWQLQLSPQYAVLEETILFTPSLQYFPQVSLKYGTDGQIYAKQISGNGSGDFASLTTADAFMELPFSQSRFKAGEAYRIWTFNHARQ